MPAARPSANRFKNRLMRQAAADGQIVTLICRGCHRRATYWAHDLLDVVGPHHEVHVPPFPCSRCRSSEFVDVRYWVPQTEELLSLTVRRPVRKVERWLWRDEKA